MSIRLVRRASAALRPAAALAVFGTLLAGCATEQALAPEPVVGGPRFNTAASLPAVRISEIHYDNDGGDVGEAVEVSFPTGTSLAGFGIVLYNGAGGAVYGTRLLSEGKVTACGGDRSVVVLTYPSNGIQNGSPDGLALVSGTHVIEFLSYEGTVTATGGPALGTTSVDIGVAQADDPTLDPIGASLQRQGATTTWQRTPKHSFDVCNDAGEGPPPPDVGPLDRVTVTGATSVDVGATVTLAALAEDAEGDGITAGTIAWTDGDSPNVTVTPNASGRSATVRGDLAGGPVEIVATLVENGVTRADTVRVTVTTPRPAGSTTRLSFGGFNRAPLPVGFEDQIFATPRDAGGTIVSTPITWRSITPDLAAVHPTTGVVRALGAGRALLEAATGDGFLDTAFVITEVAPLADSSAYRDALAFGTPTDATPADERLVERPQYALSYNKAKGTPNWVAYHLSKAVRGDLPGYRCDCFTTDPLVTDAGEVGITTADYTGSGFDRGHMVRSNDRELARGDQARTYYLSNIVPQQADQNQGRWNDLESDLQSIADGAGLPEVYVFTGPRGDAGTIAGGRIVVPTHTWKVALVLPHGMTPAQVDDPSDLLDVIAVDMPNVDGLPRDGNWQLHRTTVDAIEAATGYDVLSALPNFVEAIVESGDRKPTAAITGTDLTGRLVGETLTFSGLTSTDPDAGQALSYAWTVNGSGAGITPTIAYAFQTAGAQGVRLIVADPFGYADTASVHVTILSAAQGFEVLRTLVAALQGASTATGTLDRGEFTALQQKLDAAARHLAANDRPAAVNVVSALAAQLRELVADGSVSAAQAQPVIDYAERVARSLSR